MTYDEWRPLYKKLTKTYGKPENAEQGAAYFEVLAGFSATIIADAVIRTIGDVRFFPKAAELKERAQAASRSAPVAREVCTRCGGNTWVPGPPRHELGLVYETVERCPDCWPLGRPPAADYRAKRAGADA